MKHFTHSNLEFKLGDIITDREYTFEIRDIVNCVGSYIKMPYEMTTRCDNCKEKIAYKSGRSGKFYCSVNYNWRLENETLRA